MEQERNKGSPRLQFTKAEFENDALSVPMSETEAPAGKKTAKAKPKKRYQSLMINMRQGLAVIRP